MEQQEKRRPGRPATGVTPKRNVRIGTTWDQAEQLARQLGMTTTAYVEEALRRENVRVVRSIARSFDPEATARLRAALVNLGDELGEVFRRAAARERSHSSPD